MGVSIPVKAPELQAAAVLGRIATLAHAYRIELGGYFERLTDLSAELAEFAMIAVPETFDRIAVATPVARAGSAVERVRALSAVADPEQPGRLDRLFGAETTELYVELESVPADDRKLAVSVQGFGVRALDADLGHLGAVAGAGAEVLSALRAAAVHLGGDGELVGLADRGGPAGPAWTLHIRQPNRGDAARAATRARLDDAAAALGVTGPQRNVVQGLHDVFAHDADSFAWVRLRPDGLAPELGVIWSGVAWEHVVRVAIGLYPGSECAKRLGELAGAFDSPAAAAVELVLGPSEPPRMRVAATIQRGRTQP